MLKFLSLVSIHLIIIGSIQGQTLLKGRELIKLVPQKIQGYTMQEEGRVSDMKVGTLKYSLCEKKFTRGKQIIKFLLFDYTEAPIMYSQAMKRSTPEFLQTDSLILRPLIFENGKGWESYSLKSSSSQIFMGISNRFFLMISGENVNLDKLKEVSDLFNYTNFPR